MKIFQIRSVFAKLFVSVMLALIFFAVAMIVLTKVMQDKNDSVRSEILAGQVLEQINPFLDDLRAAPNRLQSRFMLAVIKKSFDIFDESLDVKMALYDTDGQRLIQTKGSDLPKLLPDPPSWFARTFPTLAGVVPTATSQIRSRSNYILFLEPRQPPKYNAITAMFNLFTGTLLLLVIMAVALWWIAHSITWRINHMSKKMVQLGEGDFSVRVPVKGDDEVSSLAKGFNHSAEKIEQLISANNLLLAHASHEFRTPITRIRLQIEMMDMLASQLSGKSKAMFEKRADAVNRDLTGLNELIESILLVSRLDAGHALQQVVKLDFYELVSKETQHYPQVKLYGEISIIYGQPKLLIHLVRNLLNNAIVHGVDPIEVYVYGAESEEKSQIIPSHILTPTLSIDITDNLEALVFNKEDSTSEPKLNVDSSNNVATDKSKLIKTNTTENEATTSRVRMPKMRVKLPTKSKISSISKTKEQAVHAPYLALSVIDQGNGIPEEKREDIFSPFVRLKQEKKGSGLGLSLVAQIVEAHQGKISTDTWNGHTRFLVILPTKIVKAGS